MKSNSNLEKVFASGQLAVTGELGPPKGTNIKVIEEKAKHLKGMVDAVNLTDNQTAIVRLSSIASAKILLDIGLEPVMQMVCRDRNRLAMQSDLFGAVALGVRNMLCLSGDHQVFGNHPQAKNVYDIDSVQMINM
ncbi:MAG TPA: methylenetetrahydrofolate reductase, partial [bacterium]|nr:methylenetetrahydrofolate reductase [bacterium]